MEINLNSNGIGNIGTGREAFGATGVDAGREAAGASQGPRSAALHVSSPSRHAQSADLASSEPVAEVPDSALSRDDAIGNLVKAAFNLPPPPMPAFAD